MIKTDVVPPPLCLCTFSHAMNLTDLPDDVINEIFRWLDGESLYSCTLVNCRFMVLFVNSYSFQVNKALHVNLHKAQEFEYRYRLEKYELVNTCHGERSYQSRIDVLKHFTQMWWSDIWCPRTPFEIHHIDGGCIAYELVGGVFAKTDGSSLTIQWLPSFSTPSRQVIFPPQRIGFSIKDFALDPTQDVVAFVDANQSYVIQTFKINPT